MGHTNHGNEAHGLHDTVADSGSEIRAESDLGAATLGADNLNSLDAGSISNVEDSESLHGSSIDTIEQEESRKLNTSQDRPGSSRLDTSEKPLDLMQTLFDKDERTNLYEITKNLRVSNIHVTKNLLVGGFPVSHQGHGTLIDMREWPENLRNIKVIEEELGYCTARAKGKGGAGDVLVRMKGKLIACQKFKRVCTGVAVCASALSTARDKIHTGLEPDLTPADIASLCPPDMTTQDRELQRDINAYHFCNQAWKKCRCQMHSQLPPWGGQHHPHYDHEHSSDAENETGGWRAIRGRETQDGVLPDFLGCKFYRPSFNRSVSARHNLIKIPRQHLNCDVTRLNDWRAREDAGETMPPPLPNSAVHSLCTVQRRNFRMSHCFNPIHGQARMPMAHLSCNSDERGTSRGTFWYIMVPYEMRTAENVPIPPEFALVLGYGKHDHPRPALALSTRLMHSALLPHYENNPELTTGEAVASLAAQYNIYPVPATVRKILARYRTNRDPFGVSVQTLQFFCEQAELVRREGGVLDDSQKYLKTVDMGIDPGDNGPPIFSVIFGSDDLLDLAAKSGVFAIDGTFNTVEASTTRMGASIEMTTVTMKCPLTGRVLVPMRQLSNRKTTISRMLLMEFFFMNLKKRGMRGPLDTIPDGPDVERRLRCVATDFEPALLLGASEAALAVWGFGEAEGKTYSEALRKVASAISASCGVHRKRFLLRRCRNDSRCKAYTACVSACQFTTEEQACKLLDDMRNPDSATFAGHDSVASGFPALAEWIDGSEIVRILFFPNVYKEKGTVQTIDTTLFTTNIAECGNSILKRELKRVVGPMRRGDMITVLGVCFELDKKRSEIQNQVVSVRN